MEPPRFIFHTLRSSAYAEIFDRHFKPSWDAEFGAQSSLHIGECETCVYGTRQFRKEMLERLWGRAEKARDAFINAPQTMQVFCGCDMRFLHGARTALLEYVTPGHIWCSADSLTVACCDFMAFLPSQAVSDFFAQAARHCERYGFADDQVATNDDKFRLRAMLRLLPKIFWTHGIAENSPGVWDGADIAVLPPAPNGMVMHHANFTIGAENKMRLLDFYAKAAK